MALSLQLGLIYLMSELLLTVMRRSRSKTGTKQDRSTLGAMWLVIAVSVMAGIFVARNFRSAALPDAQMFAVAGVLLFVAGVLLRWWAISSLGRFFTVDVMIERDHELVEGGPFRVVRHPSYTGAVHFVKSARALAQFFGLLLPNAVVKTLPRIQLEETR